MSILGSFSLINHETYQQHVCNPVLKYIDWKNQEYENFQQRRHSSQIEKITHTSDVVRRVYQKNFQTHLCLANHMTIPWHTEIYEEFSKWSLVKSKFSDKTDQPKFLWALFTLQWKCLVWNHKRPIASNSSVHTRLIKSLALGVNGLCHLLLSLVLQPGVPS